MANKMAALAKDTAIYGLSSILGKCFNFLLTPLFTYAITDNKALYGAYVNIYAWTGLILVILTFGMETTMFRFANKEGNDPRRVYSTSWFFVAMLSMAFAALCWIFTVPICEALGYSDHTEYIRTMSLVVAVDSIQCVMFSYLRYRKQPVKFAGMKLLNIFLSLILNVILVKTIYEPVVDGTRAVSWFSPDNIISWAFYINLFCSCIMFPFFAPEFRHLRAGFDRTLMRQMLSYSWPIVILGLAGILNLHADKICYTWIIPGDEGRDQLAEYGGCVKVAVIMTMLTQAFRYAYEPMVFSAALNDKEGQKKMYADAMKYFIIFALLAFLTVMFYMDILKFIVGREYRDGLKVIPIVMMGEIFMGVYFNLSFWYKLTDQTWWGAVFSSIGCIVLLAINFLFVPKVGYMACAWGGFAAFAICMLMSYFTGQRHYPIDYPLKEILKYVLLAGILYVAYVLIDKTSLTVWLKIIVNTGLLCVYLAYILKKDLPLRSLPVIGRYFR